MNIQICRRFIPPSISVSKFFVHFRFVLCEKCENPETVLKVTKKGAINSSCKACGHNYFLEMRHKLTTFIVKVGTLFWEMAHDNNQKMTVEAHVVLTLGGQCSLWSGRSMP